MAQISSYPLLLPQLGDSLLGSNIVDSAGNPVVGNPTVQYSISSIKDVLGQSYIEKLSASNESTFTPPNNNEGIVITFGAAQNASTDDIMIDAAGKVTFNLIGNYIIQQIYYAKATVANVNASLFFKTVKNGATQEGPTSLIRFASPSSNAANERLPVNIQSYVNITVPGTYYNFHVQNPLTSAVAILDPSTVATNFGTVVPSAQLIITKLQ